MHDDTILAHKGRHPFANHGIVNPPVYHASTVLFPSLDALEDRMGQEVVYGRQGTPTTFALREAMAALEGGHDAVICPSGLAAVTCALDAFTQAGAHVLITDSTYFPTRRYADGVLARFGVEVEYYDPRIGAGIKELLRANTSLVWLESPGSQTFEVQDVPAIAEAARAGGAVSVIDNTWGAGYFLKPLALGVDVSLQAATKYVVGHSDAMLGTLVANAATFSRLAEHWSLAGNAAGPDDVYLGLRGLRTMGVRLKAHHEAGLKVARHLASRPEVTRVMHPGLPDDPGHALWTRDFTGASGLFGFVLKPGPRAALKAMMDHLRYFGMGYSWGGFESLLIPTHPAKIRTATAWDDPGQAMRIHVGLEDVDDLIADLDAGLDRYAAGL